MPIESLDCHAPVGECAPQFEKNWHRRHSEKMGFRKGLSPDEIANLLRETFENESDFGKLSCSNLNSNEDMME
ncbi:hypothetical protein TNCV_261801 [Trichonephila clavipes]|nr:hypothetical protein TNCV_261801 [Trichonephila clavipes]